MGKRHTSAPGLSRLIGQQCEDGFKVGEKGRETADITNQARNQFELTWRNGSGPETEVRDI